MTPYILISKINIIMMEQETLAFNTIQNLEMNQNTMYDAADGQQKLPGFGAHEAMLPGSGGLQGYGVILLGF